MSLPRFFSRVSDSISPLVAGQDVATFVSGKSVHLTAPDELESSPFHMAGFLLLVNLCSRLYPIVRISANQRVLEESRSAALEINPLCEVEGDATAEGAAGVLSWGAPARRHDSITVSPNGWDVLIDTPDAGRLAPTNILTSLSAGAIGASELFRQVFAEFLVKGRRQASPGQFNVFTHAPTAGPLPALPPEISFGRVHLVGAGAIGQATAYALARVAASGSLVVVDPEVVTLSNLQRYVLSGDKDVGTTKCQLIERAFAKTGRIEVIPIPSEWNLATPQLRHAETICAAVDSEAIRISLQAALPRRLYNAWTQPTDIGWSRHENFGSDPCLACLYWPNRPRPHYHENIARSIKQHELRVVSYLMGNVPVDRPLMPTQIPDLAQYPLPPEAGLWSQRSLLEDIVQALGIPSGAEQPWKGRLLPDLYRDGVCAGALVTSHKADVPVDMAVPLAHQSVLAGIMLATELLVAASPELSSFRSAAIEHRLDLLSPFPQISARPRQRTARCLCSDPDFLDMFATKWRDSQAT